MSLPDDIPPVGPDLIYCALGHGGRVALDVRAIEAGFDFNPIFEAGAARAQALLELIRNGHLSAWCAEEGQKLQIDPRVIELAARLPLSGGHFDASLFAQNLPERSS